jgi:hypothetical protein
VNVAGLESPANFLIFYPHFAIKHNRHGKRYQNQNGKSRRLAYSGVRLELSLLRPIFTAPRSAGENTVWRRLACWDSQKKTLNGQTTVQLEVTAGSSKAYARVQIKVPETSNVTYTYIAA